MDKTETFNKELRSLFKVLREVLEARSSKSGKPDTENPLYNSLYKYVKLYDKTKPDEHFDYFIEIYKSYRDAILVGGDKWLLNNNINIRWGEGVIANSKIVVFLTNIYRNATTLKEDTEKDLNREHNKLIFQQRRELILPEAILLHLYRIFNVLIENDKEQLGKIIDGLEISLQIKPADTPISGEALTPMIESVKGLLGKTGLLPPEMSDALPTSQAANMIGNMVNAINGIFKDESSKEAIGGIFNAMNGATSPIDAIQKLIPMFNGPQLANVMGAIGKNMDLSSMKGVTKDLSTVKITEVSDSALAIEAPKPLEIGNITSTVTNSGSSVASVSLSNNSSMVGGTSVASSRTVAAPIDLISLE